MTTSVSFEIAKLLKEKEFDNPCHDCYNLNGLLFSNGWCEYIADDHEFDGLVRLEKLKEKDVLAPTIAEVVMWLYEKHGIWISVIDISPSHILWEYQISRKEVGLIYSSSQYPVKHNYSPTEAYEAAIEYTLNNLI